MCSIESKVLTTVEGICAKVSIDNRLSTVADKTTVKQPCIRHYGRGSFRSRNKNRSGIVLPRRFLLGGTITDPLNLQNIGETNDRESNVVNHQRRSGYLGKIVSHSQPADVRDPLILNESTKSNVSDIPSYIDTVRTFRDNIHKEVATVSVEHDREMTAIAISSVASNVLHSSSKEQFADSTDATVAMHNDRKRHDKIVSPAVSQKRKRYHCQYKKQKDTCAVSSQNSAVSLPDPKQKSKKFTEKYSNGNYLAYYGYRNIDKVDDPRLQLFSREMFENKDVLDIGCNSGIVTLSVAHDYLPHRILGIDVDARLVDSAKRNVRHFITKGSEDSYPKSMRTLFGPVGVGLKSCTEDAAVSDSCTFPHNVLFQVSDYVLSSDVELNLQREEYDVILALSVTKWIHLNHGDDGLRRAFRRMYHQLRPGGKLILEAQPWSSYKRKKKLTDKIFQVYQSIKFFPDQFNDYLLSSAVGFTSCELLGIPRHKSKGFQRSIYVLMKTDSTETVEQPNSDIVAR